MFKFSMSYIIQHSKFLIQN